MDIDEAVMIYQMNKDLNGNELIDLENIIVTNLYFLETLRAEVHELYQAKIFELTKDKKYTVARAENIANVELPEMYKLRHVMNGAYKVADVIRTHISFLKSERQTTRVNN